MSNHLYVAFPIGLIFRLPNVALILRAFFDSVTISLLHNLALNLIIGPMTEKEIVLETIRALPDDCSLEEIAERIEFMAAVQKGLDLLDRGEGIPHDEVKRQLASWLTN